ncbi:GAF domain-containing protein [Planosporangium flavigriseum]|uniref:Histidine kinase n=1 Tax=Planosporangium flavigriseum TaxID=373681 RepID=A0A8J3PLE1_9ACTN|nr:GAF domain-containing protein [Planosporangium flavigriseum]NJC63000.1 GAF domain-containing protein [Planosporangium flavigriseum]GIG73129.1 histidine kinase [Planosporangium flavigriseum]
MSDAGCRRNGRPRLDVLAELNEEYTEILALLDHHTAMRRLSSAVPKLTGVEVAFVGSPRGSQQLVLGDFVNDYTGVANGLVVPAGAGLGGKVLMARRPLWVSDYRESPEIGLDFMPHVTAEGVHAMIAAPILHDGRLLGVLYGADRYRHRFDDRTIHAFEQVAARMAAAQVIAERSRHAAEVAAHEERRRMALELHDTVGAMLFTLGAGIRRLHDEPNLDDTVRARLAMIDQQASEAIAALRGSLHVLSAPPEQVALGVALREHCRAFSERTGVIARMITLTELPGLAPARLRALADAAREALLNAEKHARAQSVVVSAFATRDGVMVTVSDDGEGIAADQTCHDGLGLAAVTDRLARVGGTLGVTENDDGGVTVQAWVPA